MWRITSSVAAATRPTAAAATATTVRATALAATCARATYATSGAGAPLDASKVTVERNANPRPLDDEDSLVFGATFSDHMMEADWTEGGGWAAPSIHPYRNLDLSPAAIGLHYGLECFEGMKAYLDASDNIRLFRPYMNAKRLNVSSARIGLPTFDEDAFVELLEHLVVLDKRFIPKRNNFSLYLRPFAFGTNPALGVGPTPMSKLLMICSPVGPYFKAGFAPVSLYADNHHRRAWDGGIGFTKAGGNYAPTIVPQVEANKKGHQQILWLYGEDDQCTEVGTMNMFMLWDNEDGERELVTAPLDGTILPGVTRDSIMAIARGWGEFKVSERKYTMPEVAAASKEGRVVEAFGAGTACVVAPINNIEYNGTQYAIPLNPDDANDGAGPVTKRLLTELTDIQYGRADDHPCAHFSHVIDESKFA